MQVSDRRRTLPIALREEEPAIAIQGELEQAFRAHHALVFRTAYRITGNAADAEDVLQTVFLRLLRKPEQFEAMQNPESYLRRAAMNAALDIVRARPPIHLTVIPELPSRAAHTDDELRKVLARALAQLKARPAEVFTLRFLEGLSNREIAQSLGISQVLVAVIVHRTRQQLRKELRAYLGERS